MSTHAKQQTNRRTKSLEFIWRQPLVPTDDGEVPITSLPDCDAAIKRETDDPSTAEYLVRVEWLHSVPLGQAVKERGFFGNQNSICKPRTLKWDFTLERLKTRWGIE